MLKEVEFLAGGEQFLQKNIIFAILLTIKGRNAYVNYQQKQKTRKRCRQQACR